MAQEPGRKERDSRRCHGVGTPCSRPAGAIADEQDCEGDKQTAGSELSSDHERKDAAACKVQQRPAEPRLDLPPRGPAPGQEGAKSCARRTGTGVGQGRPGSLVAVRGRGKDSSLPPLCLCTGCPCSAQKGPRQEQARQETKEVAGCPFPARRGSCATHKRQPGRQPGKRSRWIEGLTVQILADERVRWLGVYVSHVRRDGWARQGAVIGRSRRIPTCRTVPSRSV